jgi:hypothetical protein
LRTAREKFKEFAEEKDRVIEDSGSNDKEECGKIKDNISSKMKKRMEEN